MSNLFKKYRITLENTGVPSHPISFLFFVIVWSMGYCVGVVLVLLGIEYESMLSDDREISDEDIAEMIARMNEQGPNN